MDWLGLSGRRATVKEGGEMEKKKLAGVVLLLLLLAVLFRCSAGRETENQGQAIQEETGNDTSPPDNPGTDGEEAEEPERIPVIEITGFTEEALAVLDVSRADVADQVKTWADGNGHTGITGVAFYNVMTIDFADGKYSVEFRLIQGTRGNGLLPDEQVYTMDYFSKGGLFQFH